MRKQIDFPKNFILAAQKELLDRNISIPDDDLIEILTQDEDLDDFWEDEFGDISYDDTDFDGYGLDTLPREIVLSEVSEYVCGMEWPLLCYSDEYVDKWQESFNEALAYRGWIIDDEEEEVS